MSRYYIEPIVKSADQINILTSTEQFVTVQINSDECEQDKKEPRFSHNKVSYSALRNSTLPYTFGYITTATLHHRAITSIVIYWSYIYSVILRR